MKRFLFFLSLTLVFSAAKAQTGFSPRGESRISADNTEWDFGTIAEKGGKVSHTFIITNISAEPFIMYAVTTSCGCTVPEFSKKPLMPGNSAAIKVVFDPKRRPGYFSKDIYIYSEPDGLSNILQIKGYVNK